MLLAVGLVAGLALGLIVMGFLSVAAYRKGWDDAVGRRPQWRAELLARREAARHLLTAPVLRAS